MIDNLIKQLNIPGELIYLSQYGSHLYGLNTENSDLDFRGIYIPDLNDIILHKDKDEINTEIELWEIRDSNREHPTYHVEEPTVLINSWYLRKVKVDVKIFSLQKFIQLCSKGDTNALDLLFSINNEHIEQYENRKYNGIRYIYENRNILINTKNMKAYTGYALSQAVKYGIKGSRFKVLDDLITILNRCIYNDNMQIIGDPSLESVQKEFKHLIDNKYILIIEKGFENKGGTQKYLSVLGTEHQFNLPISVVVQRLETMRDKYAQRTKQAIEGTDWKALSHALRCLYQLEELYLTGNIMYPLKERVFLKDVKLGRIDSEHVKNQIAFMLKKVEGIGDPLEWSYDRNFWDNFIINSISRSNNDTL